MRILFLGAVAFVMVACTTIQVKPVDPKDGMKLVCIEDNPRVIVPNFVGILEKEFQNRGIRTIYYTRERPKECEFVLMYNALRRWDIGTFLSDADLRIMKDNFIVASANYHVDSGLNLSKFDSTESKMKEVFRQLFNEPETKKVPAR